MNLDTLELFSFFFTLTKIIHYFCVISDWLKGVQAAVCLALICNVVAVIVVALNTFTSLSPKVLWIVGLIALGKSGKSFIQDFAHESFANLPKKKPTWSWKGI